jgi:hypothetical protein
MKKRKTEEALELPILNPMEQLFQSFNTALEQEAEQKEKIKHQVKRIDAIVRAASAQIQYIHTNHEDSACLLAKAQFCWGFCLFSIRPVCSNNVAWLVANFMNRSFLNSQLKFWTR